MTRRPFAVLWGTSALSNLSDGLAFVSIPLLAATLTDDPRWVAGLASLYAALRLIVGLPVGVLVDRLERRWIIVGANLARGAAVIAAATALHHGLLTLVVLYTVMAVVGAFESFADNASVAALPSIVPSHRLDHANARLTATQLIADEFVGPPLGGMLFAVAAVVPLYAMGGLWVAAGLVAIALPSLLGARSPGSTDGRPARSTFYEDVRTGLTWIIRHRVVGGLVLIGCLASIGYMMPFSVLVLFARERLGLEAAEYGALLAVSALGGLVGTLVVARARRRFGYTTIITAALLVGAASLAGLALTTSPAVAAAVLALYIFHAVVWNVCATSIRQALVPSHLLGRVGAASRVMSLAGLLVGSVIGGVTAAHNIALPTFLGAAVFAGCSLLALFLLRGVAMGDTVGNPN